MNVTITYTVNCSHKAFELALEAVLPKAKLHEIPWRDTENMGDDNDPDFYTTFSWPNKRHPELTKRLFLDMAVHCLAASTWHYTGLWLRVEGENGSFSVTDGCMKFSKDEHQPTLRIKESAFSSEMAERLKKIATLALGQAGGN